MQKNETIELTVTMGTLPDVFQFILSLASGKSVLNIGATGGIEFYLPDNKELWLHHRLKKVANELIGIDIDSDSISFAARHGFDIINANCETMNLGQQFDLIVMSDVIEHLNAPGLAIQNLVKHLKPTGKLIITTPNPTYYGTLFRAIMGKRLNVYYDHIAFFLPEHLQAVCNRFGYRLSSIYFFGHIDNRSLINTIKSKIGIFWGRFSKRLYGSFLAVIEHG
ncbi:MAG: class I SAM-dependent methyltransferase [Nitrospirota bacterium]